MKRGFEPKSALTPAEKIKVAAAHDVFGIDQHALAFIFGVNQGRIAEAINEIHKAAGFPQKGAHND
jgi:hypothetical protein